MNRFCISQIALLRILKLYFCQRNGDKCQSSEQIHGCGLLGQLKCLKRRQRSNQLARRRQLLKLTTHWEMPHFLNRKKAFSCPPRYSTCGFSSFLSSTLRRFGAHSLPICICAAPHDTRFRTDRLKVTEHTQKLRQTHPPRGSVFTPPQPFTSVSAKLEPDSSPHSEGVRIPSDFRDFQRPVDNQKHTLQSREQIGQAGALLVCTSCDSGRSCPAHSRHIQGHSCPW
jgi:hypothetical protein